AFGKCAKKLKLAGFVADSSTQERARAAAPGARTTELLGRQPWRKDGWAWHCWRLGQAWPRRRRSLLTCPILARRALARTPCLTSIPRRPASRRNRRVSPQPTGCLLDLPTLGTGRRAPIPLSSTAASATWAWSGSAWATVRPPCWTPPAEALKPATRRR